MNAPGAPATPDAPEPTRGFFIDPAPHEFGGHLIFTEEGLMPYHALDSVVKAGSGSTQARFAYDDEDWIARLSYDDSSKLAPPEDPNVNYQQETVKEFTLKVLYDDSVGVRKASFQIAPRWPNLKTTDGEPISTPDITGVNVKTQGANIALDDYPPLLRSAMDVLGVNPEYFAEIHRYSNIFAFERYVRALREKAKQVIGTNSPMRRIFRHIDGSAKFRELREDDRNGVEGYHHRTRFDSAAATALISSHSLGKRIKHYHPEHPREDPSDPLYHPKIGVSLQTDLNMEGSVPWSDRTDLRDELDETLLNLLSWSDLPTRPNGQTFVEDAYFKPDDSPRSLTLIEDPTDGLAEEQYAAARRALLGNPDDPDDFGANATERDALRVLADGGEQDVSALADAIGKSRSTMYRVLDALGDTVRNKNGTVVFASDYLAEQFAALLGDASAKVQRDGESGGSTLWAAFLAEYGPEVGELPGDTIKLKFGSVDPETDMKAILRKGLTAWLRSGRERRRFVRGVARWRQDGEGCQAGGSLGKMDLPLPGSTRVRALD